MSGEPDAAIFRDMNRRIDLARLLMLDMLAYVPLYGQWTPYRLQEGAREHYDLRLHSPCVSMAFTRMLDAGECDIVQPPMGCGSAIVVPA